MMKKIKGQNVSIKMLLKTQDYIDVLFNKKNNEK